MEPDQSHTTLTQPFVRPVDTDVDKFQTIESIEAYVHDRYYRSPQSSISSLDGGKTMDRSMLMRSIVIDTYPSRESRDETKSVTRSKISSHTESVSRIASDYNTDELKYENTLYQNHLERSSIIESITWLGRHVPRCVLHDLSKEALRLCREEESQLVIPCSQTYRAALLFIDISGFTKLSQLLDLESLSKFINSYFQKIIDEVINHGGDVLKFAGDAVFVEWRVNTEGTGNPKLDKDEIDRCVHKAATCGAVIVANCSDYPILNSSGSQISTLNVHCGLAFGEMAGVHVGNNFNRREFIVLGDSIDQVTTACDAATHGELFASPEAYEILTRSTVQDGSVDVESKKKVEEPVMIASRDRCLFEKRKQYSSFGQSQMSRSSLRQSRMIRSISEGTNDYIRSISETTNDNTVPYDNMDIPSLKHLKKLLSFYVHPVVVSDETTDPNQSIRRSSITRRSSIRDDLKKTTERQRSEAELRSVYTIFIKPLIRAELSKDQEKNKRTFSQLNETLNLVTSVLDEFKGHLRQFIVDDKGVILIATFGLRGSTSPNMASERVLPASRNIHYALQNDLGINNYIGVTLGKAYCGVVGGILRHEFAVLGPSVNLSARLLTSPNHPGILINNEVQRKAMKWGTFLPFPPMKAKGYDHLVPVYQPLTAKEARWGKANPCFVGRETETDRLCNLASQMSVQRDALTNMIFVWGSTGFGKSDFLVHTVVTMQTVMATMKKRVIMTKNISNDGDSLVPFSIFRSIFRDLLSEPVHDDNSLVRSKSDLSLPSTSPKISMKTASAERLNKICDELGAPRGFLQIVGYHLLGHTKSKINTKDKPAILDEIVDFMAKVFIHCTSHADLTVVALDDIHHADKLSWRVVQKIFETGSNIMFICGSRPSAQSKLADDEFWKELNGPLRERNRFQDMNIGPLNQAEVVQMIAIALSCREQEVDVQFAKNIYDQTRGMPHFAAQALETCKRKGLCGRLDNQKIGWTRDSGEGNLQFASLDELLLQRIDELDELTRKALHVASVLGNMFTLVEVSGVSEHVLSVIIEDKSSHKRNMRISLDQAVKEDILDLSVTTPDGSFGIKNSSSDSFSVEGKEHEPQDGASWIKNSTSCSFSDEEKEYEPQDGVYGFQSSTSGSFSDDEEKEYDSMDEHQTELSYHFCNDTWRQKILSLLLDSYKIDIHMHAANIIKSNVSDIEESDYRTKMRLFYHLKASGNTTEASDLALKIGRSFMQLGLNSHSINVYEEALDIWRKGSKDEEKDSSIGGLPSRVIESVDEYELTLIVKLLTAMGQALGTLSRKKESADAFHDALVIFHQAPIGSKIKDRSFVFPIYSGLFFLLKYGGLIPAAQELEYENDLVRNFVEETRKNGDPVHYTRALAMQGEFHCRQGQYEQALDCHDKLKSIYDVHKHSALVVKAYATDRSAQNYGISANCLYRLGKKKEALELGEVILSSLMPQMDPKNVHNSMVMIYPVLWILKNENLPKKAALALEEYVFLPFQKYFGEEGRTFSLVLFKPLKALFTILMHMKGETETFDQSLITWALEEQSLNISSTVDNSFANFARCGSSIGAEVCLLLTKHTDDDQIKKQLIEKGWKLAQIAMKIAHKCGTHQTTYFETKPVYDELSNLIETNVV